MIAERNNIEQNGTLEDKQNEFREKMRSPNRGLKPCAERRLAKTKERPLSQMQQMLKEITSKLLTKKADKI